MAATRGRPPVIEKAELPLSDGSTILLRLVGDGKTAQIELPEQWTLQSFERSQVTDSGRTRVAYTLVTRRGKAKGARAAKPESNGSASAATEDKPKATRTRRTPAKKAAAAPTTPAKKTAAPAKKAAAPRRRTATKKAAAATAEA